MNESDFSVEEEQLIESKFQELLSDYAQTAHRQNVDIITRAFRFANHAHRGVRRLSGEPYILHPLAVARIVVKEIGLGSTSICAALLHDVVEDTDYTVEDIASRFNQKIAQIVDGLTKISGGVFGNQNEKQAVNIRKLLLTMSDDVRVVLIKIADRLHNMRTLQAQSVEKQRKIASETSYIYAPLAHRLGLFPIKDELADLSFKYLYPEKYKEIELKLEDLKDSQMDLFEQFAKPIRRVMTDMGYEFEISTRLKTVYSIWEKMQKKNVPFEGVYDLMAVRIVFTPNDSSSEKDQCWMVYSAITNLYRPHPERIRDWISMPKSNGYEALHVTVMSKFGQWIEVQIRTRRMHELAERGLAAHWKYKSGYDTPSELDRWLQSISELLEHPDTSAVAFLDTFKLNLFSDEVFAFTPKGDMRILPKGASVIDFAYQLHSWLGEHCIGAKVNRKMENLGYIIQSGDQVEILTSDNQTPSAEWMNMVVTAKAKNALKRYFNRNDANEKGALDPMYVTILVKGQDVFGILVRILNIVSDQMHLFLRSLHADNYEDKFECRIGVTVYEASTIGLLTQELMNIKEISDVDIIDQK